MVPHPTSVAAVVDRARGTRLALGALAACAVVGLVDPGVPGRYPSCPTAALLGWDCPVCGTLRGVHALTRGDILEALDHNLLLALAVPLAVVAWLGWVRQALGRPGWGFRWPARGVIIMVIVSVVFSVLRNVPIASLSWLDSAA